MEPVLINEFKDNNLKEILSALDKERPMFGYYDRSGVPYLPHLTFSSEQEIEYGTYSFRIESATFQMARVYKWLIDVEGKVFYRCGCYSVAVEK